MTAMQEAEGSTVGRCLSCVCAIKKRCGPSDPISGAISCFCTWLSNVPGSTVPLQQKTYLAPVSPSPRDPISPSCSRQWLGTTSHFKAAWWFSPTWTLRVSLPQWPITSLLDPHPSSAAVGVALEQQACCPAAIRFLSALIQYIPCI